MPDSARLELSHCFIQMTAHTAIHILYSHSHTGHMQRAMQKVLKNIYLHYTHPVQVLGVTASHTGCVIILLFTM